MIKRIVAVLIVAVMICTAFAACSKAKEYTVTVRFVNTLDEDGNTLPSDEWEVIGSHEEVLKSTKSNPATVLMAATQCLAYLSFEDGYELTADGYSIYRVSKYAEHQEDDDTTGYYTYWAAYVNGDRTTGGRQSEVQITKDGSEIEFRYIKGSNPHDNQTYVDDTTGEG